MAARPPIKAAHEAASKKVVNLHAEEWQTYVDEYLAEKGWAQRPVTINRWTKSTEA